MTDHARADAQLIEMDTRDELQRELHGHVAWIEGSSEELFSTSHTVADRVAMYSEHARRGRRIAVALQKRERGLQQAFSGPGGCDPRAEFGRHEGMHTVAVGSEELLTGLPEMQLAGPVKWDAENLPALMPSRVPVAWPTPETLVR